MPAAAWTEGSAPREAAHLELNREIQKGTFPAEATYFSSSITVQDPLYFLKSEDGVLNPEEQGPFPVDCTCYGRVILIQRWVVKVLNKDFVNDVNLQSSQTYSVSDKHQSVSQEKI